MGKYEIVINPDRRVWDSFYDQLGSGNLQQSYEYREVVKALEPDKEFVSIFAMSEQNPIGLVQCEYRKWLGVGVNAEVGGIHGYGPAVRNIDDKQLIFTELVSAMEKYFVHNNIAQAFVHQSEASPILESFGYRQLQCFNTYRVYIGDDVEKLWKSISQNKRKNVKKAQAQNVQVVERESYEDFLSFHQLLTTSAKRAQFDPLSFRELRSYFEVFSKEKKLKIFLATLNNQAIAGVFVVLHGDVAYALGAGSNDAFWDVRPNDILHWKAMEWCSKAGLSYYHMGVVPNPVPVEGSEMWGVWRWKREWNGELNNTFLYYKIFMPKFTKFVWTPYQKILAPLKKLVFH